MWRKGLEPKDLPLGPQPAVTTVPLRVTPASLEVAKKNERNERSISVCLISSSANLLSPAGHEEKANCSQPKFCSRRRDRKASEWWSMF